MPTGKQIKMIHTLKNALQMDDEEYRAMLESYEVSSSRNLDTELAQDFIDRLTDMAASAGVWKKRFSSRKNQKKYDDLVNRDPSMATPKQLRMIEAMWRNVSRATTDENRTKALRNFLARFKVTDLRFVDKQTASKIIAALESMAIAKERRT